LPKRSKGSQTRHDDTVKREANALKKDGWIVNADIPGFPTPNPIGAAKRVPDIAAEKRGHRRLIEVETPDSLGSAGEQLSTFRRSAAHDPRTKFDVVVTEE
jgi:hypothetical protein